MWSGNETKPQSGHHNFKAARSYVTLLPLAKLACEARPKVLKLQKKPSWPSPPQEGQGVDFSKVNCYNVKKEEMRIYIEHKLV